jgi:hypothetical protein
MAFLEVAGGTAIGFVLSELSSRLGRRDERTYQRAERTRERQLEAVEVLDNALRAAKWQLPMSGGEGESSRKAVFDAHDAWQDGSFRAAGLLRDDELVDRYQAAGWALLSALLDEGRTEEGGDLWVVSAAIDNAREGFAAFLLDETLPPASFPPLAEAKRLAPFKRTSRDYDALHAWLLTHPTPADGELEQTGN